MSTKDVCSLSAVEWLFTFLIIIIFNLPFIYCYFMIIDVMIRIMFV